VVSDPRLEKLCEGARISAFAGRWLQSSKVARQSVRWVTASESGPDRAGRNGLSK